MSKINYKKMYEDTFLIKLLYKKNTMNIKIYKKILKII